MPNITLDAFKAAVRDAARPNRFFVQITGGTAAGSWSEEPFAYLAKSAGLPSRTIGDVILNWQGMQAKFAGDPTFEDFTMTFINDYDMKIKTYFEEWLQEIAETQSNVRTDPQTYKAEIIVDQLGRDGETLKSYTLKGAYPKQMDQVELSMESNDTPSELSITFSIDTWEVS
jgi:hypothetical protein